MLGKVIRKKMTSAEALLVELWSLDDDRGRLVYLYLLPTAIASLVPL